MMSRLISVQPSAQAMKDLRGAYVTWSQPHSLLELAERQPPASLLDVDPPQVHEGKLPRFVTFGLFGLFKPRDRLVQLVLLHQVDPDIVVRIAELRIDLDRAEALPGGLRQAALEAHGPPQEGMCLRRRVHLDRVLVELDRSIQLSPYLVAVGLLPKFRRSSQGRLFFHLPSSATARARARGWTSVASARPTRRLTAAADPMAQASNGRRA